RTGYPFSLMGFDSEPGTWFMATVHLPPDRLSWGMFIRPGVRGRKFGRASLPVQIDWCCRRFRAMPRAAPSIIQRVGRDIKPCRSRLTASSTGGWCAQAKTHEGEDFV